MSVIPLTVFFSLLLAGIFVVLFLREQRRRHLTSPERDSLLPLADEFPQTAGLSLRGAQISPGGHEPGAEACACRSGQRTPCAHCLRRRDEQEPAYF